MKLEVSIAVNRNPDEERASEMLKEAGKLDTSAAKLREAYSRIAKTTIDYPTFRTPSEFIGHFGCL